MGRNGNPHKNTHIRYDSYCLERLDTYIKLLNDEKGPYKKKETRSSFIEKEIYEIVSKELKGEGGIYIDATLML